MKYAHKSLWVQAVASLRAFEKGLGREDCDHSVHKSITRFVI